jgi:hypothetical protein
VNVDVAAGMSGELDLAAKELNISRQAVIKTRIRQALDQQYLARGRRRLGEAQVEIAESPFGNGIHRAAFSS